MGQLVEMARFREREEPEVISNCLFCDAELYKGQTVTEIEIGHYTCDPMCYIEYVKPKWTEL